ncbi:MAG TPA: efflux RND transporter periplasmic adaptor subunit [Rhodanobacteraceae bacterium]|nr:efflux RND transporter periplasmic adaptor subunit [Rhodanobacteraceae bacterium]
MARWKLVSIVLGLALLGFIGYRLVSGGSGRGTTGRGGPGADEPVAVTVVPATRRDVPVRLEALGTVQALNTVTLRPQVSGQIEAITFREGQEIKAGEVIARLDARPLKAALDQVRAKKVQDQAQLATAQGTLKRYEELGAKHFVSAQDLENQRHSVGQFQAALAADDAAIASAQLQLDYATIRAPIDGVAGIRQVDVGNVVQANSSAIVVLAQMHPITVIFSLPEQHLDAVRGVADALKVEALDRGDSHVLATGALTVVDNQIDPGTGTFKLKAQFDNADNALWPGQFVNVRVEVRTLANALVVPAPALQRGPEGGYVFVVGADGAASMQAVQTGVATDDGQVVISQGLQEGQPVVTEGQFRLKQGSKVLALKPGETPPPAAPAEKGKRGAGARRGG